MGPTWKLLVKFGCTKLGLGNLVRSRVGVCHADELFLMFKAHGLPINPVVSHGDKKVQKELVDMWTNFAHHHNPTPRDYEWSVLEADALLEGYMVTIYKHLQKFVIAHLEQISMEQVSSGCMIEEQLPCMMPPQ